MKRFFVLMLLALFVNYGQAQIVAWNLKGATGSEVTSIANMVNANLETSVLTRGSGVTASAATDSFASTWPLIAAQSENCYYEFTVKAKNGYAVSLSTIDVKLRVQTNGPKIYIWKYSLDGGVHFTDIGTPYTLTTTNFDFSNNDGIQQPTVNLSGIGNLQDVPSNISVIFRIYAWNSGNATSGFRIGKSLTTSENTLAIGGTVINTSLPPLVHFVTNGGSAIEDLHPSYNTTITAPTNPVRAGYTFAGWYKEAALVNLWNFATDVVKTEINLYAKWNPILYNVTFNSDGGTAVSPIQAYYNDKINEPLTPTKSGHMFGGWYKEAALTNPWNFSTDVIQGDVTLYAKWNNPAQSISFGQLENKVYGDAPFVLNAVASSGLAIVYEALTPNISINGNVATIIGTGTATIRATQPGNSFYNPAAPIEVSFTISKASQTITFAQVGPYSRYIGTVTLKATSSSSLPVSFVASEPTVAEINGAMLNVKGLGSIAVTASQAGNEYYLAAEPVTRTIVIHTGGPLQLLASQGLSPNGDGINDVFIVEGIKSFEKNQVRIMNSGGIEVFNKKGYDNQTIVFNGKTNKGEKLPAGTYYYMIEVRQGQTWLQKKGYLVLRY